MARLPLDVHHLRIGEGFDVEVPSALHQFWGEDTHGAVVGGKGLVQLSHHPADGRGGLHQVNVIPRLRQIEGGLDAGDASPHDENGAHLFGRLIRG